MIGCDNDMSPQDELPCSLWLIPVCFILSLGVGDGRVGERITHFTPDDWDLLDSF